MHYIQHNITSSYLFCIGGRCFRTAARLDVIYYGIDPHVVHLQTRRKLVARTDDGAAAVWGGGKVFVEYTVGPFSVVSDYDGTLLLLLLIFL